MNNMVMCIGRVKEISTNKNIRIVITMPTTNELAELNVFIPTNMKETITNYLHVDDLVGVKGHLKEDSKNHSIIVMADRLSFLSKASDEVPTDDEPSDDIDENI